MNNAFSVPFMTMVVYSYLAIDYSRPLARVIFWAGAGPTFAVSLIIVGEWLSRLRHEGHVNGAYQVCGWVQGGCEGVEGCWLVRRVLLSSSPAALRPPLRLARLHLPPPTHPPHPPTTFTLPRPIHHHHPPLATLHRWRQWGCTSWLWWAPSWTPPTARQALRAQRARGGGVGGAAVAGRPPPCRTAPAAAACVPRHPRAPHGPPRPPAHPLSLHLILSASPPYCC